METQCVIGSPEWMRSVDRRLTELNRKMAELGIPKITINPTIEAVKDSVVVKITEVLDGYPNFEATIAKAFAWLDDTDGESLKSVEHYRIKANVFIRSQKV